MKKTLGLLMGVLFLSSCAHHRDVRAGADGVHRVVLQNENQEEGAREAISQANHFCEKRKLSPAFIDEKKSYTGDVDEETYKKGKAAARVAKTVGGAVWVFGGKRESSAGGLVGLGGAAGDAALGEGYTVEMRFKCQ